MNTTALLPRATALVLAITVTLSLLAGVGALADRDHAAQAMNFAGAASTAAPRV